MQCQQVPRGAGKQHRCGAPSHPGGPSGDDGDDSALMSTHRPDGPPLLGAALGQALRVARTPWADRVCEGPNVCVPRVRVNTPPDM